MRKNGVDDLIAKDPEIRKLKSVEMKPVHFAKEKKVIKKHLVIKSVVRILRNHQRKQKYKDNSNLSSLESTSQ